MENREVLLSEAIMGPFLNENMNLVKLVKRWWVKNQGFTEEANKKYPIQCFKRNDILFMDMIFLLYGKGYSTHFKIDWMSLVHHIVELGQFFSWEIFLSPNLLGFVHLSKEVPKTKVPNFYMFAYLLDVVCSTNPLLNTQKMNHEIIQK